MCALADFNGAKRTHRGRVVVEANPTAFRVRGTQGGQPFDKTFPNVAAWRSYRALQRVEIDVRVMGSVGEGF